MTLKASVLDSIQKLIKTKTMCLDVYGLRFDNRHLQTILFNPDKTAGMAIFSDEEVDTDTDDQFEVNLSVKDMDGILKLAKGEEDVRFDVNEGLITVYINNVKKVLPFQTEVTYMMKWPSVPLTQSFTISDQQASTLIKAMDYDPFDVLIIMSTPEGVRFIQRTDTSRGTEVSFSQEELVASAMDKDARAVFPIESTLAIIKARPSGADVEFSFDTDVPVMMAFDTVVGKIRTLVAPRIEVE